MSTFELSCLMSFGRTVSQGRRETGSRGREGRGLPVRPMMPI